MTDLKQIKLEWFAELFRRACRLTPDLDEARLAAQMAIAEQPLPPPPLPTPPELSACFSIIDDAIGRTADEMPIDVEEYERSGKIVLTRHGIMDGWGVARTDVSPPLVSPEHGQGSGAVTIPGDHAPEPAGPFTAKPGKLRRKLSKSLRVKRRKTK